MTAEYNFYPTETDHPLSMRGRFSRLSYIGWNGLLNCIAFFILVIFSLLMGSFNMQSTPQSYSITGMWDQLASIGLLILTLLYTYFNLVLIVRRLHDRNHSGWWALLLFLPLVNFLFMIYLLFAAGDAGINRFGHPRRTLLWEKTVAWLLIALVILSFFVSRSTWIYLSESQPIEIPREVLQKATPYF
ncbi:DUF805 domain-containing protein [Acinetobacter radioresistens]|jgi:uncharacterized membrane protein YhaH (DUF805 family)|uniref:DUF805 domain-containing protein n=1 Tax=Acinetobacter radioresistens TaxID=40216 RepID=UPI000277C2B0|nr:DUF805 domain-containing protein [Acinetobacter radioresistens]EJO34319.1 PF05656 family protein [Acinetobacter radioresistens WC-A-157]MCK4094669.1 DUF805 domain-containing protein [Acinetobacter radioresistens]MCX0338934.1 DUF805 domain-containing protein [Acinetobacter radioresistens]MDY0840493.1 DUF805 domain-containing protein [Acinetobacter radioresistens]